MAATMQIALFEHRLAPGADLRLPPALRILYLRDGSARLDGADLAADTAVLRRDAVTLSGAGTLWRIELTRPTPGAPLSAEDRATLILRRPLARDASRPFVLRLDSVTFTPGVETPRHGHHGEGIRRLIDGHLMLEIAERHERRLAGEAWFETGEEPVVACGVAPGTAFLRALVMDAAMQGQSSFRAWTPEDALKPRGVTYRLYLDEVVSLP